MSLNQFIDVYQPEKIYHREEQISKLSLLFQNFLNFQFASNVMLLGVTGSGKTTILKKVIKEYDNCLYISANQSKTSFKILKDLNLSENTQFSEVIKDIINYLKANPKIIVIDELNKVTDIPTFFDDLNTIYRETNVPIILATNNQTILGQIPEDAKLTLFFDKIRLPAYNSHELYDIAKGRISQLPEELQEEISETSLRYICAISAKQGSARVMLDLLRRCIISHNFSEDFIDKLTKEDEREEWSLCISSLNETEKNFLVCLVDIIEKKVREGLEGSVTTSEIKDYIVNLSPSRISQLITTFSEDYGMIKTEYVQKGRAGGRYRTIYFSSHDTFTKIMDVLDI